MNRQGQVGLVNDSFMTKSHLCVKKKMSKVTPDRLNT